MARSATARVQECVEAYLFAGRRPRLLLFRRPPARGGWWVPVSGKVEPDDPDLPAALRRELVEETGFDDLVRVLPLDWRVEFEGSDGRPWRLHGFAVELASERSPRLSDEHDAFAWVDPPEAIARLHYPDNRAAVDRLLAAIGAGDPGASL